jgi:glucosamine-phosphate N-acetyltransferase
MVDLKIFVNKIIKEDIYDIIEFLKLMSEFKTSQQEYFDIWNDIFDQNFNHYLAARIDGKIVGIGSVVISTRLRGGKIGHIEDISTLPNHRRKGVGKAIVNSLYEIAKKNGCYKVTLECKKHNVFFYEKCDYDKSGIAMKRNI